MRNLFWIMPETKVIYIMEINVHTRDEDKNQVISVIEKNAKFVHIFRLVLMIFKIISLDDLVVFQR